MKALSHIFEGIKFVMFGVYLKNCKTQRSKYFHHFSVYFRTSLFAIIRSISQAGA